MPTIIRQFRALRPPVRSLVFLFWIYSLTTSLTSVFIQLFLYQEFLSFSFNVIATMVFNTGVAITFCILGFLASRWRMNIKYGFFWSFVLMGFTLIALLKSNTPDLAYLAMGINGLGNGLFWLTIHTFELSETRNEERDFYSSLLTAGTGVVSVGGPALATFLLWISGTMFHFGEFTLLFLVTPLFYLLGFFAFSKLNDYHPEPVDSKDILHFLTERKNRSAQPYLLATAWQDIFVTVTAPLAILFILGGAIQVGLYATTFAFLAVVLVLVLSQYRTIQNRLPILRNSTLAFAAATFIFGSFLTFPGLLFYGIAGAICWPVIRVSIHVTDLHTMESIGRRGRDFYATMLFRDGMLWFWRMVGGLLMLCLGLFSVQEGRILGWSLYLYALSLVLVFLGARHLLFTMGLEKKKG